MLDRPLQVAEMKEKVESAGPNPGRKSLGLGFQELTPDLARDLGVKQAGGVVVTQVEPGTPAAEAGLQSGDVIREVNRKPVKNAGDFMEKIEKAKGQERILLLVQRGENHLYVAVPSP
jgi:serine protease Do